MVGSDAAGNRIRLGANPMTLPRSSAGFSLIEAIAVMVLLGIGIVAIMSMFSTGTRTLSLNVDSQVATQLVQQRAEQILADRRNPSRGYAYVTTDNRYPNETPVTGFPNYNRTVTATNPTTPPCPPGGTCRQFLIQVSSAGVTVVNTTLMVVNY